MSNARTFLDEHSIYLVLFWRISPPGDDFHWGVYIKTADVSRDSGTLYHANQTPGWRYEIKNPYSFEASSTGVLAVKIGTLTQNHTTAYFDQLFAHVPVGYSVNEPATMQNPWDCAVWTRDAIRMLNHYKVINCPDVVALSSEARRAAASQRDLTESGEGWQRMVSSVSR